MNIEQWMEWQRQRNKNGLQHPIEYDVWSNATKCVGVVNIVGEAFDAGWAAAKASIITECLSEVAAMNTQRPFESAGSPYAKVPAYYSDPLYQQWLAKLSENDPCDCDVGFWQDHCVCCGVLRGVKCGV